MCLSKEAHQSPSDSPTASPTSNSNHKYKAWICSDRASKRNIHQFISFDKSFIELLYVPGTVLNTREKVSGREEERDILALIKLTF